MSLPLVLLKAFALLLALFLGPLSMFGLCCMVTWQGLLLSAAIGALGIGPLLYWIGDERGSMPQMRLAKILLALSGVGIALVLWQIPDAHTPRTARIHSRYSDGGWHYSRFAPGSVLPEIDQIHLGYAVASALDPLFTQKQRRELSAMTDAIYTEAGADPDFTAAGSALTSIYSEMSFGQFRDGHYYHYIPAKVDRTRPTPALVFLHGSGGNFKAYIWLLSKLADELGITVIAPTFGLGNWEKKGGYEAITRAIADAGKHAAIDPDHIHLMGLSNGGKGLCLAESAEGPKFRSLIFLSAVLHTRIKSSELAARLQPRRVLILSGGSDDRVPWEHVSGYAEKLKAGGLDVTSRRFDGEDHFLFFHQRAEVLKLVAGWIAAESAARIPPAP
ncbi:alpha/beta hydrolase [Prosthecobacter sp.]|uniref:alpha/beta hydrolase n=1 Tax=Prosthecobacter sp. TaxID=1965333 RepID=UPI0037845213